MLKFVHPTISTEDAFLASWTATMGGEGQLVLQYRNDCGLLVEVDLKNCDKHFANLEGPEEFVELAKRHWAKTRKYMSERGLL